MVDVLVKAANPSVAKLKMHRGDHRDIQVDWTYEADGVAVVSSAWAVDGVYAFVATTSVNGQRANARVGAVWPGRCWLTNTVTLFDGRQLSQVIIVDIDELYRQITMFDMTGLTDMPAEFFSTYGLNRMASPGINIGTLPGHGPCPPGVVETLATAHLSTDYLLADIEGWPLGGASAGYDQATNDLSIASYKDFLQRFKSINTHTKVGFWCIPTRANLRPRDVWPDSPGYWPARIQETRELMAYIKAGLAPYAPDFTSNDCYWISDTPEANDALFRWNYAECKKLYPDLPFYTVFSHHSFVFNHGLFLNVPTLRWVYENIRNWSDGAALWEGSYYAGATTIVDYPRITSTWDGVTYQLPGQNKSANYWLRTLAAASWKSMDPDAQPWIEFRKFLRSNAASDA